MMPGLDPKRMKAVMKQMGINQEDIDASRVVIEKHDGGKIIIENPEITKIKMQGQESFQIAGDVHEEESNSFSDEDIQVVMDKTECTRKQAIESLKETGDLAETILNLSK